MGTLLKFLLLAVAVLWLWHSPALRGKKAGGATPGQGSRAKPPEGKTPVDTMVACAHCGVHLPASEATRNAAGASFCSGAHRDLHP